MNVQGDEVFPNRRNRLMRDTAVADASGRSNPHRSQDGLSLGMGAAWAAGFPKVALAPGALHEGDMGVTLSRLERQHSARLGLFARNTVSGRSVLYRAHELFPMSSVVKTLAAAAVLRDLNNRDLARRVHYTDAQVAGQYAPVTGTAIHLSHGMTIEELCAAAVSQSDGAAGNLLLRELGGPVAITGFCRSIGDLTTRLDSWEPELNSATAGRIEDTTSPVAIARTYTRLVLGDVLTAPARRRLMGWLRNSKTDDNRVRAGLPINWTAADNTGSANYGIANDVSIAWTPDGSPITLAILTTQRDAASDTPSNNALIAQATALVTSVVIR